MKCGGRGWLVSFNDFMSLHLISRCFIQLQAVPQTRQIAALTLLLALPVAAQSNEGTASIASLGVFRDRRTVEACWNHNCKTAPDGRPDILIGLLTTGDKITLIDQAPAILGGNRPYIHIRVGTCKIERTLCGREGWVYAGDTSFASRFAPTDDSERCIQETAARIERGKKCNASDSVKVQFRNSCNYSVDVKICLWKTDRKRWDCGLASNTKPGAWTGEGNWVCRGDGRFWMKYRRSGTSDHLGQPD